jgi:hypothetical protein
MPRSFSAAVFVASFIAVTAVGVAQGPEPGKADLEARGLL